VPSSTQDKDLTEITIHARKATKHCLHFLSVELCFAESTLYHGHRLELWSDLRNNLYGFARVSLGVTESPSPAITDAPPGAKAMAPTSDSFFSFAGDPAGEAGDARKVALHNAKVFVEMKLSEAPVIEHLQSFLKKNPMNIPVTAHPSLSDCKIVLYQSSSKLGPLSIMARIDSLNSVMQYLDDILSGIMIFDWAKLGAELALLAEANAIPPVGATLFADKSCISAWRKAKPLYTIQLLMEMAGSNFFFDNWAADTGLPSLLKGACDYLSRPEALNLLVDIEGGFWCKAPKVWAQGWAKMLVDFGNKQPGGGQAVLESILANLRGNASDGVAGSKVQPPTFVLCVASARSPE
jgi:hypothetical protein